MGIKKRKKSNPHSIPCKLERFEEQFAVLNPENSELPEFRWPIQKLPEGIKKGETFVLKIGRENIEEEEQYKAMRKLLEELVN